MIPLTNFIDAAGATSVDPFWTSNTLLMNMENAATDTSVKANTITATNITYSNTVFKYGVYSAEFNGTNAYMNATNANFALGSGDFTIEAWVYPTSLSVDRVIVDTRIGGASAIGIKVYINTQGQIVVYSGTTTYVTTSAVLVTGAWQHIAVVRMGGVLLVFIRGDRVGEGFYNANLTDGSIYIGRTNEAASGYFSGYIEDIRITKGSARYKGYQYFTPIEQLSGAASIMYSPDIGNQLITKEYMMDVYPSLSQTIKAPALWGWGYDGYGQLGDNTVAAKSSPVQTVAGGTNWKYVASNGNSHTLAIKTDGTLWSWGYNAFGQLGDNTITNKSSPVQTVAGGTTWASISSGNSGAVHSAAIKTDGTLWLWGYNDVGQLGDNSIVTKSSPVQTVTGGTTWKSSSHGRWHTSAIKTDGTLWSWGRNELGQLGDNSIVTKSSPIQTVAGGTTWKSVSSGSNGGDSSFTAAIKTDGTLWLWGGNAVGQLGDNTVVHKSSPVQTIAGGTNWKQVACGYISTSAIKTDGTLWTWGGNAQGQLGNYDVASKSSPIQTICGGTNWKNVSGYAHIAAIKTDGTLWVWGHNNWGQLGDTSIIPKSSPIQTIAGGTNWKQVSAGGLSTYAISELGNW